VRHHQEDAERENLLDHAPRIGVALDAVVGKLVGWQALFVEAAEAGLVAKKRPVGDLRAATQQLLDGAAEPDQRRGVLAQQRQILRLRDRAAAERNDARLLRFVGFGDDARELLAFDAAELGFAGARENFGDRRTGRLSDAPVEIDVRPTELPGEQTSGSRFAAAHETCEADQSTGTNFSGHEIVRFEVFYAV